MPVGQEVIAKITGLAGSPAGAGAVLAAGTGAGAVFVHLASVRPDKGAWAVFSFVHFEPDHEKPRGRVVQRIGVPVQKRAR